MATTKTLIAPQSSPPKARERPEPSRMPDVSEIAKRAYEKFLARAGGPGSADEDWLAAERELTESDGSHSASPVSN
jgi:hypothetical protein